MSGKDHGALSARPKIPEHLFPLDLRDPVEDRPGMVHETEVFRRRQDGIAAVSALFVKEHKA